MTTEYDYADFLTDAELDELEQFLAADARPEDCMDLAMLDGFLTGILVGPTPLPPSRWLPVVWGETADAAMSFQSVAESERIVGLILRLMNERMFDLAEDSDDYEPLIYSAEEAGEPVPVIDEWCTGFMTAAGLDEAAWQPLLEDAEHADLLFPMMLYGTESGWDLLTEDADLAARHDEFAASLGDRVLGLRDYWLPARKAASTYRRDAAKVGRNDPCPCGSGRKYKKCCGATAPDA